MIGSLRTAFFCLALLAAGPAAADEPPRRIVSLLPSLTEILFAIGAGERVVGVTDYCSYPSEAATRKRVGGYLPALMNREIILGLAPDLVLAKGDLQRPAVDELRRLGLRVEVVEARSVAEVATAIRRVAALTGDQARGERVARALEAEIEALGRKLAAIPAGERPRTFYEVWEEPLMTAGGNAFISQLIELAGGRNLFAEVDRDYFQVSLEEVIRRDPEVILRATVHDPSIAFRDHAARPAWRSVRAVREGRVHALDGDIVSRPGPRIGQALELIARRLHPALFPATSAAGTAP